MAGRKKLTQKQKLFKKIPNRVLLALSLVIIAGLLIIAKVAMATSVPAQVASIAVNSGSGSLIVKIAAPADNGSPITSYIATCTNGTKTFTASAPTPPVTLTGLTNNIFYSCSAHAVNALGPGPESYVSPGMPGLNYTKTTYTYCTDGSASLGLDFFRPKTTAPVPVVMFIHGGGWWTGQRSLDNTLLPTLFTSRGFGLATIDYTLADIHGKVIITPFQQEQDAACALRFMRAHTALLNITYKIAAMGTSAGGNLASLLGVNPPVGSPTDQWPKQSNKVNAVVDEFGITEFDAQQLQIMTHLTTMWGAPQSVIQIYGPNDYDSNGKPVYVSAGDAPTIIVHGIQDHISPIRQGQDFYNSLQVAGVPSQFIPINNMDHMFIPVGGNPSPPLANAYDSEINFLNTYLR